MHEYLEVGKIVNTHGVSGEVKVIPLTDNIERFNDLDWVYIDKFGKLEKYNVMGAKLSCGHAILKLEGIDSMNEAELLKGLFLKVDRSNAVKLPEDVFFICDIIDCEVFDENRGRLGIVKEVLETGSNDVYVVDSESGQKVLIPALKSVVKKVSIVEKKIFVTIPEGLMDDEI